MGGASREQEYPTKALETIVLTEMKGRMVLDIVDRSIIKRK